MHALSLLVLLAIISLLSVLLDRRWAHGRAAAAQAESTGENTDGAAAPAGMFSQLLSRWSRRFGRNGSSSEEALQTWLATAFADDPAEAAWLDALTPEQAQLLRGELVAYCSTVGFDLRWWVEQAPLRPAALERTGKMLVQYYCQSLRASVLVQNDLQALQRYQIFLVNPTSKQNLAFGQQLYGRLVDDKLAPVATPDLLMAGEKERQSFVVQSILAAAQNETSFGAALKAVALGVEQPASAASPAPAAATGAGELRSAKHSSYNNGVITNSAAASVA